MSSPVRDNASTFSGRAGADRHSTHEDRDARPVRCSVWLYSGPGRRNPFTLLDRGQHLLHPIIRRRLDDADVEPVLLALNGDAGRIVHMHVDAERVRPSLSAAPAMTSTVKSNLARVTSTFK